MLDIIIKILSRIGYVYFQYRDIRGEGKWQENTQNLTEPMYYILLSLLEERCGVDIMEGGNMGIVKVGPGTLYALLARFERKK